MAVIDKWKNKGFYPQDVILKERPFRKKFLKYLQNLSTKLIDLNSADFSDLILHTVKIFENYKDISELYSKNLNIF